MIRIDDLVIFIRVASLDSFSAVGREMDLLPSQISAAIKRLERELDIRLFARSTRSLRLTAEGEQYLPYARAVVDSLNEGKACLQQTDQSLKGTLQIACSSDFGRNVLLPWLIEFRQKNPSLVLRLSLSDHVADIYREPVDVAVRYGMIPDAEFVSLPLLPLNRRILAAAPAYLEKHGRPRRLEDLFEHACLRYHLNGKLYDRWVFPEMANQQSITVNGPVISDDADVIRRCAIAGEGILYKSWLDICQDVRAGHLEVLLPEQPGELFPLHFICPHRKQFSPSIRSLYTYLRTRCESLTGPQVQTSRSIV
ncbi:LysR family transcriptional regulator [Pseudomonas sp. NPDC090203]|uniref:LysR family transcriptional regulator n=1 Tax=Pseudomonas sp. NPDC090203 TaxID=3364477 RepID=UPI003813F829